MTRMRRKATKRIRKTRAIKTKTGRRTRRESPRRRKRTKIGRKGPTLTQNHVRGKGATRMMTRSIRRQAPDQEVAETVTRIRSEESMVHHLSQSPGKGRRRTASGGSPNLAAGGGDEDRLAASMCKDRRVAGTLHLSAIGVL